MTESEILKLKELCEKKTCATWYAYRDGDGYGPGATVRGPFFRWLRVEPGNDQSDQFPQNKGLLADDFDDAQYAAAAMNAIPALLKERDEMREALKVCLHGLNEAKGCFDAAETEGLTDVVRNSTDEELQDLVSRRLLFAYPALDEAVNSEALKKVGEL